MTNLSKTNNKSNNSITNKTICIISIQIHSSNNNNIIRIFKQISSTNKEDSTKFPLNNREWVCNKMS